MFGRDKRQPEVESGERVEAVIGPLTTFNGTLRADGTVRIEGVVEGGRIVATGNVLIAKDARVQADIEAQAVSIAGAFKGSIKADRVELLASGRVWGELHVRSFLLDEGGYFSGNLIMQGEPPEPPFEVESLPPLKTEEKEEKPASSG